MTTRFYLISQEPLYLDLIPEDLIFLILNQITRIHIDNIISLNSHFISMFSKDEIWKHLIDMIRSIK